MSESVEEFLKRGGKTTEVPFGESGQKLQMKRRDKSRQRVTYESGKSKGFNNQQPRPD